MGSFPVAGRPRLLGIPFLLDDFIIGYTLIKLENQAARRGAKTPRQAWPKPQGAVMAQVDSENSIGMPAGLPTVSQETLLAQLAKQEAQRQRTLKRLRRLRQKAADEIDRLLKFLDASDLDPDLEETADNEPSLGWTIGIPQGAHCGGIDDLEAATEDDENDLCDEPSLGSVGEVHHDQTRWAVGSRSDLEVDGAESGIGDYDGLMEQVGTQDWQQGGQG
jgi:hypothetical protein